jgi:phosphatidylserine/phosphatidylglycerophosphate/cardiolipin synthase-like enzyme
MGQGRGRVPPAPRAAPDSALAKPAKSGDGGIMSDSAPRPAGPEPGASCWRIARAAKASVIVDAADYFEAARQAMLAAEHRIMLIGWDFDARIRLRPEEAMKLGDFVLRLVRRRPALEVYLLRWDMGALKTLFRGTTILTLARWMMHKRIHTRLDGAHPPGGSHHQKIVVIDDCFAFCGGIDMTGDRWDTRGHEDSNPHRRRPGGKPYGPWHDATTALEGPVAAALGELARDWWKCAGGGELEPVVASTRCWPDGLRCQFQGADVAVSRTRPDMPERGGVREIERLVLDQIEGARRHIYAESQYFASRRIAEAIARRLAEPAGPEIVLVNPVSADGWLEQVAMDTARARLFQALHKRDPHGRFRLYHPFTAGGAPIYVHAKIMVVDDRVLRVGSSNFNNRSLGLDSECDVTIDAGLPANAAMRPAIRAMRDGLIAEHLGADPAEVARNIDESGSLIAAIEKMRGPGRSLRPYEVPCLNEVEAWLADNEVLDPESPEEMFEPFARRGLFRRRQKAPR